MSDLDIFGPWVDATQVYDAVVGTIQTWFETYAGMVSRTLAARGGQILDLPDPGSYVFSSDPNHFPEEAPPAVLVCVPGTLGQPKRDGTRAYRSFWDVRVTVFVTSTTRENTERLAAYYGAAMRLILEQKGSLEDFAQGTEWLGEALGIRVADRDERTLGSSENRFSVDVRDVVQSLGGPTNPITSEPADWPTATSVRINYTPAAINS